MLRPDQRASGSASLALPVRLAARWISPQRSAELIAEYESRGVSEPPRSLRTRLEQISPPFALQTRLQSESGELWRSRHKQRCDDAKPPPCPRTLSRCTQRSPRCQQGPSL